VKTALVVLLLMILAVASVAAADAPECDREEIHFSSGHFELAGDLLAPRDGQPHPVVVYVWGSGPTNRNAHIERSQVLRMFLESGFSVFLYDKPGSGSSTGEFTPGHLFEERAAILLDAVAMLKKRDAVDSRAIGLYGSSQASYVMAVALAQTSDVDFVIAWSCPMESSIEQSAYLVRNYVLCEGGSKEQARAAEESYLKRARARTYPEYRAAAEVLEGIPAIRDGLGWAGVESEEQFTAADTTSEDFLDPSHTIASLKIPILALFAENDRQIDPVQGAAAYRRLVAASGQTLSSVVVIPGADHNMNLSPRGCMQDQRDHYRNVGGATLSPVFLETVKGWLGRLNEYLGRS
jgi:pimeloyl-ACP methyl ester carboxylesterase